MYLPRMAFMCGKQVLAMRHAAGVSYSHGSAIIIHAAELVGSAGMQQDLMAKHGTDHPHDVTDRDGLFNNPTQSMLE